MEKKPRSILLSTTIIYFIILLVFVGVRIIVQLVDFPISAETLDLIATGIIQVGIMFLFPVIMFSIMRKQKVSRTFNDFGFSKIGLKH